MKTAFVFLLGTTCRLSTMEFISLLLSINGGSDVNAIVIEGYPTSKSSTVINAGDLLVPGRQKPFYITLMLGKKQMRNGQMMNWYLFLKLNILATVL